MSLIPKWFRSFAVALIVLWLVQAFVLKVYYIPSPSMQPTLLSDTNSQDRVLVNRAWQALGELESGNIIVFQRDPSWDGNEVTENVNFLRQISEALGIGAGLGNKVVKRVIASGGQDVSCCDTEGNILVEGKPIRLEVVNWDFESGKLDCNSSPASRRCFEAVKVPKDSYFVLGDNRQNSSDSLSNCFADAHQSGCIRFVNKQQVTGKVVAIVWPLQRIRVF